MHHGTKTTPVFLPADGEASWLLKKTKKKTNLYGPFLWMGFNCLKATGPLQGGSLLFTTKFPESPGTHLINLGRMKVWSTYYQPAQYKQKTPITVSSR